MDSPPTVISSRLPILVTVIEAKDYQTSLPYIEKASKIKHTSTDYLIALGVTTAN